MAESALAAVGRSVAADAEDATPALAALAALGQPTRLMVFRLLMRSEPSGASAGAIAESIGCPQNTLSAHLGILARAGLVRGIRSGRSIIYRAEIGAMRSLLEFLVTDCCDGHPELCDLLAPPPSSSCGCAPAIGPEKRAG